MVDMRIAVRFLVPEREFAEEEYLAVVFIRFVVECCILAVSDKTNLAVSVEGGNSHVTLRQ